MLGGQGQAVTLAALPSESENKKAPAIVMAGAAPPYPTDQIRPAKC